MSSETQANAQGSKPEVSTSAREMRAIVQDRYGSADVLRIASIRRPDISANQVLVKVSAAGVDRGTEHLMTGRPFLLRIIFGLRAPKNPVLGLDVAGTVVATGSAVTRFSVGDEVFGFAPGSFAEYVAVAEDKLGLKPATATFEQAAVVPVSALTALQALRDVGKVTNGQRVLIIGASGGVGSYAVQLAKALGAEVTGVCSTAKLDLVRSLGADHVIDYSVSDFADGVNRYDLILDTGGNASLSRLRRAATRTGTIVLIGAENSGNWTGMGRQLRAAAISPFVRQRLPLFATKQRAHDLGELADLIDAGTVTPSVDRTFPLGQVPDAMRYLKAGKARGKVAITV